MSHCDFVAGWTGGMVGLMVGHPLDTIKVNQQTLGVGMTECTRMIYQKLGWKGFFRGMGLPLIARGAMNSMFFGVYGYTLEYLQNLDTSWNYGLLRAQAERTDHQSDSTKYSQSSQTGHREMSYFNCFIAGIVAGGSQLIIGCPAEVVKIKLQTRTADQAAFRGPIVLVKHILRTEGIRGLYQGVFTMALGNLPGCGVYMFLYEFGASHVRKWCVNSSHVTSSIGLFLNGGITGVLTWWLVLPMDTIKSHLQAQDKKSPNYRGAYASIKYIFKQQGLKGFFRGFTAVSIRAFPVNGAILLTYEWVLALCHYFQDRSSLRLNA